MDRRSALLGGEQRPGNSAGEGSAEFTPGELPPDRENAGEPLTGHDAEVRRFFMEKKTSRVIWPTGIWEVLEHLLTDQW